MGMIAHNSFIRSIGKSAPNTYHGLAVSGMIPVYSIRDVPGPYPPPPPHFFVSVHSTGLNTSISHLFSTLHLQGSPQVLILKRLGCTKTVQVRGRWAECGTGPRL